MHSDQEALPCDTARSIASSCEEIGATEQVSGIVEREDACFDCQSTWVGSNQSQSHDLETIKTTQIVINGKKRERIEDLDHLLTGVEIEMIAQSRTDHRLERITLIESLDQIREFGCLFLGLFGGSERKRGKGKALDQHQTLRTERILSIVICTAPVLILLSGVATNESKRESCVHSLDFVR